MNVRTKVTAGLVVAAAVANGAESIGTRLLLPAEPEGKLEALRLVAEHRPAYAALVTVGTLAVPMLAAAFWTMTAVARERAPRLGMWARVFLLAGMWGFAGMHVLMLCQVPLSAAGAQEAGAEALAAIESSPLMGVVFLLPFLLGCSVGLLLLVAALFRSALPRWIPVTMLGFFVVDFVLQNGGPVDGHWLFIAASVGVARHLVRPASPSAPAVESSPHVVVGA